MCDHNNQVELFVVDNLVVFVCKRFVGLLLGLFVESLTVVSLFATGVAQTTEAEGDLKKQNTDTIHGWKKGGNVGLSFSQTSNTSSSQIAKILNNSHRSTRNKQNTQCVSVDQICS